MMKDDRKNHSNKMKEIEGKDPRQSGEREKEKIPTHIYIYGSKGKKHHIHICMLEEKKKSMTHN